MGLEFGAGQTRCGSQFPSPQRRFRVPRPGRRGFLVLAAAVVVLASAGSVRAQGSIYVGLTQDTDRGLVGTTHTVTGTLFEDGVQRKVPGAHIAFQVTGNNPTDPVSVAADDNGQATFSYTGSNAGDDLIFACYDPLGNHSCQDDAGHVFQSSAVSMKWVEDKPDLAVTKKGPADPVQVGDLIKYTITIDNQGGAPAPSVRVVDNLPGDLAADAKDSSQGTCDGTTSIVCNLGTIEAGASATVTIDVIPTQPGELANTAIATTDSVETDYDNNSGTASTLVTNPYILTLSPENDTNPVGTDHTVTASLTQDGESQAEESIAFFVSGANSTSGFDTTNSDGRATFTYTGENAGSDTILACFDANGSDDCDPDEASAEVTKTWTSPEGSADLTLTKTAAPLVNKGAALSYSLVVTNHGPSAATAVTLTDKLPSGVAFSSASASQGSCSGGGTVTCALGTMKVNGSATVTIVVTATTTGYATNAATVKAKETDPKPDDNTASATTRIMPRSDLGISGTVTPDAVRIGGDLKYHVVVKNAGPDTAEGTLVPLTIPAAATLVSVTPSQGICIPGGPVLCFLGMIASGGSATIDLVLRSSASGHLVVSPTVSSDGSDSNGANNATTLVGTVAESFDLRVEMTATPEKVGTGDWITYTITATNLGPGAAEGVKVDDQLPDGGVRLLRDDPGRLFERRSAEGRRRSHGRGQARSSRLGRLGDGEDPRPSYESRHRHELGRGERKWGGSGSEWQQPVERADAGNA